MDPIDQDFKNGVYYWPGKRVLSYFIITSLLPIVILFCVVYIGVSFVPSLGFALPAIAMIGIFLCVLVLVVAYIKYKIVKFMFDEFSFHVEKGIFSKSEIAIPYKQIQNVNHEQSFLEKMWGIAHVFIETAGTDESQSNARSEGVLPILDTHLALSLEKELLQKSSGK